MATDPIRMRLTDDQEAWLVDRSGRATYGRESTGLRVKTELGMWRAVLGAELHQQRWSLADMEVIAGCVGGPDLADAVPLTVGQVAVAVIDGTRGDESAEGLVARLLRLGPAADLALADAVSRWWATDGEHSEAGWAAVGVNLVVAS